MGSFSVPGAVGPSIEARALYRGRMGPHWDGQFSPAAQGERFWGCVCVCVWRWKGAVAAPDFSGFWSPARLPAYTPGPWARPQWSAKGLAQGPDSMQNFDFCGSGRHRGYQLNF